MGGTEWANAVGPDDGAPLFVAQPKPTAVDVLRSHSLMPWDGKGAWTCSCSRIGVPDGAVVFADRDLADQHQADMLAAAGYPTTPEALAEHDAQVAARAWAEGCRAAEQFYKRTVIGTPGRSTVAALTNPYRIEAGDPT